METQTRFDLNAAIANWQQELAAQPDLPAVVRCELETHLRDTVTELQGRGLNSEESFWLACRRVGSPRQLNEEFAKSDPARIWRDRVFWMMLVLLLTALWQSTVNSLNILLSHIKTEGFFLVVRTLMVFAGWLPILVGALLLSKGRLHPVILNRLAFFNSRLRVATAVFSWIGVVAAFHWLDLVLTLGTMHSTGRGSIWVSILMAVIFPAAWPMCLVSLLLWVMPRRSPPDIQHV